MLTADFQFIMFLLHSYDLTKRFALTALKLRYRNSVLGFFWSVLSPLFIMIVLSIVFIHFFPDRFDVRVPYPVFLIVGLLMWRFFTYGTTSGLHSVTNSAHIIRKVYFPREILPLSAVITALVTAILEFAVFFVLILFSSFFFDLGEFSFGPTAVIFIYFLFVEFILVLGLSLLLSSVYVLFRDISHIWEVVVFAGFFATPIFYPLSIIPYRYERFLHLNPLSDIITGSREVLVYGTIPGIKVFICPLAGSLFILLLGITTFRLLEKRIAKEV
ncbi:MAG: ABC transporter permease [Candidatus Thermoplasmatota archaeon]|jgi:ABC-type polysaccharide/polyol phosphate export permease|nr:ABC transporter permease [Candidatus Thermoplasmatota archaeon]